MTLFVDLCGKKCLRRYQRAMRLTENTKHTAKNRIPVQPRFFEQPVSQTARVLRAITLSLGGSTKSRF